MVRVFESSSRVCAFCVCIRMYPCVCLRVRVRVYLLVCVSLSVAVSPCVLELDFELAMESEIFLVITAYFFSISHNRFYARVRLSLRRSKHSKFPSQ